MLAMAPDIPVIIGDDLCQPHGIHRLAEEDGLGPLVIGACSKLRPRPYFWEEANKVPVDTYSTRIVDLLQEIAMSHDDAEATERIKLLLWAQMKRTGEFKGVSWNNLRLGIARPHGEVSRREFATTLLPQYSVIP
ncbi:MAG: hypothetical protein KAT75_00860, partial [Dehalococcoidia bacterium]|nr:hypothetical protein [Dehalococcoidia bacterium]